MHQLKFVTITGADESVDPKRLNEISRQYPFVEWGFLLSRTRTGREPRYPSLKWLSDVSSLDINKSVHVCGQMARAALENPQDIITAARMLVNGAKRVQLNVSPYLKDNLVNGLYQIEHAAVAQNIQAVVQMSSFENHPALMSYFSQHHTQITTTRKFLFGDFHPFYPDANSKFTLDGRPLYDGHYPNLTILHDASGGRGIAGEFSVPPLNWSLPGFAGGLNPENLASKLDAIYAMDGNFKDFWVDMESGVRTDDQLDLDKVQRVLEICKTFMRFGPFDKTLIKESE